MKKKQKPLRRFAICARGYDVDAVESYIALESAKADEIQLADRNRIKELQDECARLKADVDKMKSREEQIKSALIVATQNAEKLSADVRARYAAELKRLQLFRAKWCNAYEQMRERYHFDKDALNMESVAVSVELELKKFLSKDFSLNNNDSDSEMEEYFRKEAQRLTTKQVSSQKEVKNAEELNKLFANRVKEDGDSVAFSLDEALHPTESLEEICKSLF